MPVFTIQSPDGRQIEIEATDEATAVRGAQEWASANPVERKTSQTLGMMKGMMPALEKASLFSPANLIPGFKEKNTQSLERLRADVAKRETTQRPGALGQIEGSLLATAPILMVTKNPFGQGAAQGAALSESDNLFGIGLDAATGAALNWAGGKVMGGVADAIKPVIDPAVKRLKAAGVSLTPGMVKGGKAMTKEDKLMSRPFVGDAIAAGRRKTQETFNTAAVNDALAPLGKKVPAGVKPGNDAIAYANDEISRAYDLIIPNLSVRLNGQAFMQPVAGMAATLPKSQQRQVQQIASVTLRNGQLTGQALKDAQGELRRLASEYAADASAPNREMARVLRMMDDQLTREMIAQNPKWAPQLQKANEAYRGYRIVADAASRADEGLINTGQLKQSVRRGDRTKGKNATARGDAFMQDFSADARKIIPARTPDSGTAGRMQAQNLFANLGGAKDALAYRADDAYQQFRLAPRPAGARKLARTTRRLKGPAGAAAIAATSQDARD